MNFFNKRYSLGKAMKLAQKPKYKDFEFVLYDPEQPQLGYKLISKEEAREHIDEVKKKKRNEEFEKRITGEGKYKNINQEVGSQYNQYQKSKKYQPPQMGTR